jgi:glucuronoarabinoxylan endo-1,4-beta-xylanase
LASAGVAFILSAIAANAQQQITNDCLVDWNATYQEIDGFGASSAFVGDWTSAWADMFFSTNTGIGLSLLRSRIAPDGTVPDYNIMQMAQARGARVWSTPWSPPANFKDSGTVNGGYFLSTFNQPYASQLANYVLNMKTNYQVDLYAVSVQNEPDWNATTYESCIWTAQQIHDFVPYLYQALSNNGVGSTKIIIAEQGLWNFALTAAAMSDLTTSNMVGILGAHDYDYSVGTVDNGGKPLWETEVSSLGGSYDGSITNGLYWANQIHAFMTIVQANAFNYWWLIPQSTDNEGLTDASGNPAKRMYVLGQFSRFVRPGYYRIAALNNAGTLISAYKDGASGNFAIVAINTNSTSVTQLFNLTNFTAGFVTPWITDDTLSLSIQTAVPVTNASFSYVLPPQSVVTFVGQTNLNVTITMQPQNQMVNVGDSMAFSISVSGATPLNYFWQQSGAYIAGATNATCFLTNVPASDSGSQFSCVVSNVYGAITSSVATLTVTPPVCVEPPPDIVAWWLGGSNAVDIIGGNNGVLMNGVGFTNALVGSGFVFNGGTGYVQLPPNLFPLPNAHPFSIELWFETSAGGVILAQQAATPFGYPSGESVPDMYVGTNGTLYVQMFWDGTFDQISTTTPVNDGTFHHLAVTYDGINEVVYLDGAEMGIKRLQYSSTSSFPCQFGTGYTQYWPAGNGGWYSFNGIIDQPALYSNALTAAQVQSIYNAGSAGKCTDELLPVIVAQPTNQTVAAGATAVFSVSATSLSPLTYQWLGGTTTVADATNAILTLTHATTNNPGNYAVVISSFYGAITSSVATLTITNVTFNVSATLLPNRDIQMTMTSWPGNVFRVLASTNLLNWQTIATLTNFTGTMQFTDPVATNFNRRFYQMVTP